MMNNTIEAYLLASSTAELNEVPLARSRVDVTSDRLEAQMEAIVQMLAESQASYDASADED